MSKAKIIVDCPHCLVADAGRLGVDVNGEHFTYCKACRTRSFLPLEAGLAGLRTVGLLAAALAKKDQTVREYRREVLAALTDGTRTPVPSGAGLRDCDCTSCLAPLSARLRIDRKRFKPFTSCQACGATTFIKSKPALAGLLSVSPHLVAILTVVGQAVPENVSASSSASQGVDGKVGVSA